MNDHRLLEMSRLTTGYGKKTVVRDIDLHIGEGEIVTLLGSNGVGKSTILRTIIGQLKPWEGQLLFDGRDMGGLPPYRIASLGVGYCPEGRHTFGNLTVMENLVVGGYLLKTKDEFRRNLQWVYTLFPRLQERSRQLAETLSGGEQQMLAIARALITRPRLLLLGRALPGTGADHCGNDHRHTRSDQHSGVFHIFGGTECPAGDGNF